MKFRASRIFISQYYSVVVASGHTIDDIRNICAMSKPEARNLRNDFLAGFHSASFFISVEHLQWSQLLLLEPSVSTSVAHRTSVVTENITIKLKLKHIMYSITHGKYYIVEA